jgi:hypothetical protein
VVSKFPIIFLFEEKRPKWNAYYCTCWLGLVDDFRGFNQYLLGSFDNVLLSLMHKWCVILPV